MIECWEDMEAIKRHNDSDHFKEGVATLAPFFEGPVVPELFAEVLPDA